MPDEKTNDDADTAVEHAGEAAAADRDAGSGPAAEAPQADASFDDAAAGSSGEAETPGDDKRRVGLWLVILVVTVAVIAGGWWLKQRGDAPPPEPARAVDRDPAPAQSAPATRADAIAPTRETRTAPAEDLIPAATQADIDALRDEIGRLSAALDEARGEIERLRSDVGAVERDNTRMAASIEERVDLLDSLPGRVLNLEQGVETLQGISAGSRDAWLLAEAEYYMQIANAQVQLANNPALAARALQLADQRVRELANPAYTPVRRAIADELAALGATEDVDVEGITLSLGSLAAMVPALPLVNDIVVPEDDAPGADLDALSGWARASAATREALSGMVRVRRSDERVEAMLSPEAEYFLRLNLQLQLQAARLSLLLGDSAGFRQSLDDAATWLGQYFDREDAAVTRAIETLEQMAATAIVTARPDVSGSLTLLRRQRTLERAGE